MTTTQRRRAAAAPEPFVVTETPKARRLRKALEGPKAIPPDQDAVELLESALASIEEARRHLERAGRSEDLFQLGRYINDLRHRLIPRVRTTACSDCAGYRPEPGQPSPAGRCRHIEEPAA